MRVRYTLRAFADREEIFNYLNERNPQAARAVVQSIVRAIRLLASHPRMGAGTDEPGVRELIVPRRPYKVYYTIKGEAVRIIHIRDARRRPWGEE